MSSAPCDDAVAIRPHVLATVSAGSRKTGAAWTAAARNFG